MFCFFEKKHVERFFLALIFCLALFQGLRGQSRSTAGWTDFGSGHINKWIKVAPATMGPNALPVPQMDYAKIAGSSALETGIHAHFMQGDTAINSYLSFSWVVVPEKVEVRIWGFPTETFRMTNAVRDRRQIYYDDTGWITHQGDLWISTRIQILNNRKTLPDLTLNYSFKNTTGLMKHGRYADAGTNYFYLAMGKSFFPRSRILDEVRIAGLGGLYLWQTNKVEMAQDEGPLVEAGIKLYKKGFSAAGEIGGYFGYDVYEFIGKTGDNDPLVCRLRLEKTGASFDWNAEFISGLNDYLYKTFKIGLKYKFNAVDK